MKLSFIVSILALFLNYSCTSPQTQVHSVESDTTQIYNLIRNSIHPNIHDNYSVAFGTTTFLDSVERRDLSNFLAYRIHKFSNSELVLLNAFLMKNTIGKVMKKDDLLKDFLLFRNPRSTNLFIKEVKSIEIDSAKSKAIAIVGTYFSTLGDGAISGWDEILILNKDENQWEERQKIKFVEY